MSRLSIQPWVMPAPCLGGENPLAPLCTYETASAAGAQAPADVDYPDRGYEASILPYRLQDQYDRNRRPRAFKTAVLENEHLRATFLLELGGRLWSLVHKPTGRELLFVNPVFQPANLAVRDAWFSGGVEWNISIIGHSPFTCAPLFAARVLDDRGNPVLRMYEWDRIRRVPFQIDCWLSDDAPFLMVRVKISNPHNYTIPMYWWSNIAVPERKDVRVLAPADQAYRHNYDGRLVEHDVPIYDGVDVTYTTNRRSASDLYFRIPQGHRPWIAALDGEGRGLVHTSTDRLLGRKMFNWGIDTGGQRWQEFLAAPGHAYIEIQGGLAQTQGEYVAMPAGAQWSWLEAYGLMEADSARVHSARWEDAHQTVERALEQRMPRERMNAELEESAAMADRAPVELLHQGSGWGALERRRRERAANPLLSPSETPVSEVIRRPGSSRTTESASIALPFPDSALEDDQMPWLALLERGELPDRPPSIDPGSLMVQPEWRDLLERALQQNRGDHWLSWYHLGVMRYRAADRAGAKQAWERSLQLTPSPWAYRDLAVLAREEGDASKAAELWLQAARQALANVPLAIECAKMLSIFGRQAEVIAFIEALPPQLRSHGRIRLLRAAAAQATGDLDTVDRYFEGEVDIANIRESEISLSDLWFDLKTARLSPQRGVVIDDALRREVRENFSPPRRFDFRMKAELS